MNPTEFSDSEKEKPEKTPKSEVQTVFQELQFMAMQKGTPNQFDLNKLDKEQLDRVLNTMAENEKNAYLFHTKKIDAIKEIELRKIDASVINQNTIKVVLTGVLLIVLPIITLVILLYKETFFIPWLTFLTGMLGGLGISKIAESFFKENGTINPIKESDDN